MRKKVERLSAKHIAAELNASSPELRMAEAFIPPKKYLSVSNAIIRCGK